MRNPWRIGLAVLILCLLAVPLTACTKQTIEEGRVKVLSSGEEFEPYKSWSHGSHDGVSGDAL